jgi:hypothetical protein
VRYSRNDEKHWDIFVLMRNYEIILYWWETLRYSRTDEKHWDIIVLMRNYEIFSYLMFHFDDYLRFLVSKKNVPLWRLFEISDQYEECSTVTIIWGFWSVRRMFHCDGYLRFLISTKNISVFLISTRISQCFSSVRDYLIVSHQYENISVFLISTRISHSFSSEISVTVEHSSYWSEISNNRQSGTFFLLTRNLK